jgi:hypothetical protein
LKTGDFVERKNGNVERKKAKDYAKDSVIAGAANADPGVSHQRLIPLFFIWLTGSV